MASQAPAGPSAGVTKVASPGAFTAVPIKKIAEGQHKYINMLIYGPHGAGKTTLLGSACDVDEMKDILVIAAEGGAVVYEGNDRINNPDSIAMIKVDRIEQFQKSYEWLKWHCSLRDREQSEARDEELYKLQEMIGLDRDKLWLFRTVIVDSLSEIEAQNLAKILNLDALGFDAGDDMEVAGFPQFRKNNHLMQRIVRQFRDLPIHCLMTCAQSYSQDERKAFHYAPKLTGQLTGIIQGFFDIVGWLVPSSDIDQKTGERPRRLFVQPQTGPKADAKCRLASYKQDFFDNPTMHDIMVETKYIRRA